VRNDHDVRTRDERRRQSEPSARGARGVSGRLTECTFFQLMMMMRRNVVVYVVYVVQNSRRRAPFVVVCRCFFSRRKFDRQKSRRPQFALLSDAFYIPRLMTDSSPLFQLLAHRRCSTSDFETKSGRFACLKYSSRIYTRRD
jgi:hypothetical protein